MTEKTLNEARLIIAGFLKKRRIELGMTQAELAQKTGLARKTIYSMEAGKFWLGLKQYLILCEALSLFPAIAEMEANTPIAEALRKNWTAHEKAMSLEDAIRLKERRHIRNGDLN